jgi:hypothetical protein
MPAARGWFPRDLAFCIRTTGSQQPMRYKSALVPGLEPDFGALCACAVAQGWCGDWLMAVRLPECRRTCSLGTSNSPRTPDRRAGRSWRGGAASGPNCLQRTAHS